MFRAFVELTLFSLFLAKSDNDFLIIFPVLVIGKALTEAASLKAATGPTCSRIIDTNSFDIMKSQR